MKNRNDNKSKPVAPGLYTKKYFLNWGEYPYFIKTKGDKLFVIHERITRLLKIKAGMRVLDLGCGRGELLVCAARQGAEVHGVDYSKAAIKLSQETIKILPGGLRSKVRLTRADIKKMSFPADRYDRILMIDLIEHLRPWEVDILLSSAKKALKRNGQLIIHTWPNKLVLDYGYPIYNAWQFIRRKPLLLTKREPSEVLMHVNEQTPLTLKRSLKKHGFTLEIILEKDGFYENLNYFAKKKRGFRKFIVKMLARWPLNHLFLNEIYAVAQKK